LFWYCRFFWTLPAPRLPHDPKLTQWSVGKAFREDHSLPFLPCFFPPSFPIELDPVADRSRNSLSLRNTFLSTSRFFCLPEGPLSQNSPLNAFLIFLRPVFSPLIWVFLFLLLLSEFNASRCNLIFLFGKIVCCRN